MREFKFNIGDKVYWASGKYEYYHIVQRYKSNGNRYNMENPYGHSAGINVNENELQYRGDK